MARRGLFALGGRPPRLLHTRSDEYRIKVYDLTDGSLARIIERSIDRRAPSPGELERAWEAAWRWAMPSVPEEDPSFRQILPAPEAVPFVFGLHVDDLNAVWVRRWSEEGEDQRLYDVFDPEGIYLGEVLLPAHLEIFEIGEDYILGSTQDDLGVQYVTVYSLDRGRADGDDDPQVGEARRGG